MIDLETRLREYNRKMRHALPTACELIRAAADLIGKLPVTADRVTFLDGDTVYAFNTWATPGESRVCQIEVERWQKSETGFQVWGWNKTLNLRDTFIAENCYSTEQAAEQAGEAE